MPITTDQIYNTRERFFRQTPNRGFRNTWQFRNEVFQAEFLSELDPDGHKINDPTYYENIIKEVPIMKNGVATDQKRLIEVPIERVAIPLQKVILGKHLTHLCGEELKFVQHKIKPSKTESETFISFKQGWKKKNMETAKYEFCESVKATGDGAFCAVLTDKVFSYRVFSVLKGDTLHPIRDFSGNLRIFGRGFTAYDYERMEDVPYLEVWDDKNYTLFSYSTDLDGDYMVWDSETFLPRLATDGELDGWAVVKKPTPHGFKKIPIEYLKNEAGACWSSVQPLIDKLEMALSQLFENNKSYAFRIMVVKGDVTIQGDLKGQARAMLFDDKEGGAEFMDKADASTSFELQLKETLKYILMGSFTVLPPENVSGDLPGVTIKLLYSPAIEGGLNDKNFYNKPMDRIVDLFKEGYGVEKIQTSNFTMLDLRGDIQIYIHQNESENTNNMVLLKNANIVSAETLREQTPYAAPDEEIRMERQEQHELELQREELVGSQSVTDVITETTNDGMNDTNVERQLLAQ